MRQTPHPLPLDGTDDCWGVLALAWRVFFTPNEGGDQSDASQSRRWTHDEGCQFGTPRSVETVVYDLYGGRV